MNIVYLNIDGVIRPYNRNNYLSHINEHLEVLFSRKYKIDYTKYSIYDIYAAYYDWNKQALKLLKHILDETNSKIITTSDLRDKDNPEKIKDLLKLHGMDNYWLCDTPIINTFSNQKITEIEESLKNIDVNNFVILDDNQTIVNHFPNNAIEINNLLTKDNANTAIKILKKNF